ncbi:MAG: response regulator transcription factor [Chitinophagaceae bacterium]
MNSIKAIIADDEILARDIIKEFIKNHPCIEIVSEADNGITTVNLVNEHLPDVLFLDIQMPDLNGFDALKELESSTLPLIIFTTAYDKYALKAFEASAIDYLLKPFNQERFDVAIERAKKYMYSIDKNYRESERQKVLNNYENILSENKVVLNYIERLFVRENKKLIPVQIINIQLFEADNDYIKLHIDRNTRKYLINNSLANLEKLLNPDVFVRIHKSSIIKISAIAEMRSHTNGEYKITMKNGAEVKLSRNYKDALKKIYTQFEKK